MWDLVSLLRSIFFDLCRCCCRCSINTQIGNNATRWKRCRFRFNVPSYISVPLGSAHIERKRTRKRKRSKNNRKRSKNKWQTSKKIFAFAWPEHCFTVLNPIQPTCCYKNTVTITLCKHIFTDKAFCPAGCALKKCTLTILHNCKKYHGFSYC